MSIEFKDLDRDRWGAKNDYPAATTIASYLKSNTELDVTADLLTTQVLKGKLGPESEFTSLCTAILQIAAQIPVQHEYHSSLVLLVQTIKSQGVVKGPTAETQIEYQYSVQGKAIWADHIFYYSVMNLWEFSTYKDAPTWHQCHVDPEGWANVNTTLAMLTSNEVQDCRYNIIGTFREGLERVYGNRKGCEALHLDRFLPSAAVWFIYGARWILADKELCTAKDVTKATPTSKPLWTGEGSRWSFWKARFEKAAEDEECKEETRELARQAAEAMETAEIYGCKQLKWDQKPEKNKKGKGSSKK